jgi:hypothetical protein
VTAISFLAETIPLFLGHLYSGPILYEQTARHKAANTTIYKSCIADLDSGLMRKKLEIGDDI